MSYLDFVWNLWMLYIILYVVKYLNFFKYPWVRTYIKKICWCPHNIYPHEYGDGYEMNIYPMGRVHESYYPNWIYIHTHLVLVFVRLVQFRLLIFFMFNLVLLISKMVRFWYFFVKLRFTSCPYMAHVNYNVHILVKMIFYNLYIKSLHLNTQIISFFTSVKNYKCKNVKK